MCKSWQGVFQSLPGPFCNFSAFYSCHARKSFGRQYIVSITQDYRQTLDGKGQTTSQVHQTTMLRSSCLVSGGEFQLCSWVYDLTWSELECSIYIQLCSISVHLSCYYSIYFHCFVCLAFSFVCSVICIVLPYVYSCSCLLCTSVRTTATMWKHNSSK